MSRTNAEDVMIHAVSPALISSSARAIPGMRVSRIVKAVKAGTEDWDQI